MPPAAECLMAVLMTERRWRKASACNAAAPVRHQYNARVAVASPRLERMAAVAPFGTMLGTAVDPFHAGGGGGAAVGGAQGVDEGGGSGKLTDEV